VSAITSFSGPFRFLSNFYPVRILYGHVVWPSVEHAYQAAKTSDVGARLALLPLKPGEAKRAGRKLVLRPDWDLIKLGTMEFLLRTKFAYSEFESKLLATGRRELIEENWWGDTFWGRCRGEGGNHLGRLLMKIRSELGSDKTEEEFRRTW